MGTRIAKIRQSSCFSTTGVLAHKQDSWRMRLDVLVRSITAIKCIVPAENLTHTYLFFNGY